MAQDSAEVIRRLDVIANLLTILVAERGETPSVTSRIMVLHEAGLEAGEIGGIIGKASNYVSGVLSQKKARKRARRSTINATRRPS